MVQPLVFLSIAIVCDLLRLVCELSQIPTIPHLQPQGGVNVEIYGKLMRDFRGSVTLCVDFCLVVGLQMLYSSIMMLV